MNTHATASEMPGSAPEPAFRLMRYFATGGALGMLLVLAALVGVHSLQEREQLVAHQTTANVDITRALANSVWREHQTLVHNVAGKRREQIVTEPTFAKMHADVQALMHGLKVAKVKLYNLQGLTAYSSDLKQVGEDKAAHPGFQRARQGEVVSDFTHRDKFDAFDQTLVDRDLVFSYIPIWAAAGRTVEAVAEVYSDVTELQASQVRGQWEVAASIAALLAVFYGFLLLLARRADAVIKAQTNDRLVREQQLAHQAAHDALTGLPNRAHFAKLLDEAMAEYHRLGTPVAVLLIDLDHFKAVNDTQGHEAGDEVLRRTAQRLKACLEPGELAARLGGDEFTVLLRGARAPARATEVANRLRLGLAEGVALRGGMAQVRASVGIALAELRDDAPDAVVRRADEAMYRAKYANRGATTMRKVAETAAC